MLAANASGALRRRGIGRFPEGWKAPPNCRSDVQSLTPYERQVLVKIGADCKPNSPIKDRRWTEPPWHMPGIDDALRVLGMHGMVTRKGGQWRKVKPTTKGWKQIDSEKASAAFVRNSRNI